MVWADRMAWADLWVSFSGFSINCHSFQETEILQIANRMGYFFFPRQRAPGPDPTPFGGKNKREEVTKRATLFVVWVV
jgi:hypothetical protein